MNYGLRSINTNLGSFCLWVWCTRTWAKNSENVTFSEFFRVFFVLSSFVIVTLLLCDATDFRNQSPKRS
jgi:hypothetical protein